MEHAGSLDVATVGWVEDLSGRNIESNGGTENGVGGYVGRAYRAASAPLTVVAAAGGREQPLSESSLMVQGQQIAGGPLSPSIMKRLAPRGPSEVHHIVMSVEWS